MIRRAESEDAEAVLSLAKELATSIAIDDGAFHASFTALVADRTSYLAVAEVNGQVIGYVLAFSHLTLYANGPVAWVEEITLTSERWKKDVGRALMHGVEEWAMQRDCKLVALATRRGKFLRACAK